MRSYRFITKLALSSLALFFIFNLGVYAQNKKLDRTAKLELDNQTTSQNKKSKAILSNANNNKLANNM